MSLNTSKVPGMPATSTAAVGVKAMDQWREFVRSRYNRETRFLDLEVGSCGVMGFVAADFTPPIAHARRPHSPEVQPSCTRHSWKQWEGNGNHVQTRLPITTTSELRRPCPRFPFCSTWTGTNIVSRKQPHPIRQRHIVDRDVFTQTCQPLARKQPA